MKVEPDVRTHLLESLLERMALDPRLAGLVSPVEAEALAALLGRPVPQPETDETDLEEDLPAERSPPSSAPPPEEKTTAAEPSEAPGGDIPGPRKGLTLDLSSRSAAPAPGLVLCLDFGTSQSKVGLFRDGREVLPLRIGGSIEPFSVDSALSLGTRIHFGSAAREAALRGAPIADRLKRYLGHIPVAGLPKTPLGGASLRSLGVSEAPEDLRLDHAVVLYLAWLTHRAREAARSQHGLDGRLLRRFALPCWPTSRWLALQPRIAEWIGAAEVVADTFGPTLLEDGVPRSDAKAVLERLSALEAQPGPLVSRAVAEPVAAAASRFGPEVACRGLVLVVDMGAGTTDLALFWVEADPDDGRFELSQIEGGTDFSTFAGDAVDRALAEHLGVGRFPSLDLLAETRAVKEALLQHGEAAFRGRTVTRGELLGLPPMLELEALLRARIAELMERVAPKLGPDVQTLRVCLAGGGARLPAMTALVRGETQTASRTLTHRPGPELPRFVGRNLELRANYPRLAVALGGASGYLPASGRVGNHLASSDVP
ncbi:MAG: hypothetical protein AAFU79_17270 [Myxococcota bacterium]